MFCQKCGKKNPEGVAFCGYCGAKLIEETPAASDASEQKESGEPKKRKALVPILIALAAAIGVGSFFFFQKMRPATGPAEAQEDADYSAYTETLAEIERLMGEEGASRKDAIYTQVDMNDDGKGELVALADNRLFAAISQGDEIELFTTDLSEAVGSALSFVGAGEGRAVFCTSDEETDAREVQLYWDKGEFKYAVLSGRSLADSKDLIRPVTHTFAS